VPELWTFDDKPMNPNDQSQPDVEALLLRQRQHHQWLQDAGRSHTKNLFGLWFLLVIGICVPIFATLLGEEISVLLPISTLLILLVVLTGAYVFQEVARVHRRIDAVLRLIEAEEKK
jgi:hypothetical protein